MTLWDAVGKGFDVGFVPRGRFGVEFATNGEPLEEGREDERCRVRTSFMDDDLGIDAGGFVGMHLELTQHARGLEDDCMRGPFISGMGMDVDVDLAEHEVRPALATIDGRKSSNSYLPQAKVVLMFPMPHPILPSVVGLPVLTHQKT
ncbi:hypothetical protein PHLCEN_2v12615 [Hermanssonia centrifuga]|uniref:Uncharacterized protein n=1 Tax=Hermanssonia centrifuga TaxID=98765 RepID=A0A2R6NGQ1_9APHY|nr:hypothetical protein PHLCEN_2v12615 [Hermanssonia centrifuga]